MAEKGTPDPPATLKVVADPALRPGVWQLRDGFGSVLWEWDEERGSARTPCETGDDDG